MYEEKNLEKYIEKILQIQNSKIDSALEEKDLKTIALDMGMSESDWLEIQRTFEGHLTRAKGFINYNNWDDAISEGEQAIILNPHHIDALYALAYSYAKRWEIKGNMRDKELAQKYAGSCLQINPAHTDAIRMISYLKTKPQTPQTQQRTQTYQGGQQSLPNADGALVLGIISIALFWCYGVLGIITGVIALVLGNKAKKMYKANPHLYTEKSYKNANAGTICAIIGLIISGITILGLFSFIASIPFL